jgi:fatty acid amide hydrolase
VRGSRCALSQSSVFVCAAALQPTPVRTAGSGTVAPHLHGIGWEQTIKPSLGPLGRCTEDILLVLQAWWSSEPGRGLWSHDTNFVKLPLDMAAVRDTSRPLRIGFYSDDGFWKPAPSCARAVDEAVAALRLAGHTVEPWNPNEKALLQPEGTTMTVMQVREPGRGEGEGRRGVQSDRW